MKIAVISDVHGNLDALVQVFSDIDAVNADAVVCLGDNIGYGPQPDDVVKKIQERNIPSVMGNHELAVTDRLHLTWFNPVARKSLQKTFGMLSGDAINYICGMEKYLTGFGCRFVHGFPPDSQTVYQFQVPDKQAAAVMKKLKEDICFTGHTHILEIIDMEGDGVTRSYMKQGKRPLEDDHRYIINVGSVGQPRDGDNRAKYVVFDTMKYDIDVRCVSYDIQAVVDKMTRAGLPRAHANRLW